MGVGRVERIEYRSDIDVRLVNHNASDMSVVKAARVSTLGSEADEAAAHGKKGLINFLMRDRHGSPFEHNSMTFLVSAPIFVFREFHRHRVGWSYNEESGRYKTLAPKFYLPSAERNLVQVGKAGAYEFVPGTIAQHTTVDDELSEAYFTAWGAYERMLEAGVAREVARMALPVGIYSSMYATCNARSLMHFLGLRTRDERARVPSFPQREIEMVAEKMEAEWAQLMPVTHATFSANGRVAP